MTLESDVLKKYKNIAVVDLSRDSSKDSYRVAEYLKKHGFRIFPINPVVEEILGEKSYKSLIDLPVEAQKKIEIVDVFRPVVDIPAIVEQAIKLRELHGAPHVVWMQLGITNESAAAKAREAGLNVIMDKCMMREHKKMLENLESSGLRDAAQKHRNDCSNNYDCDCFKQRHFPMNLCFS